MIWLWMGLWLGATEPKSLTEWLEVAERPHIEEVRAQVEAAHAHVDAETAKWPAPSLAYGWSPAPIETRLGPQRHRLGIRQPLPWLGRREAAGRTAAARAEMQGHRAEVLASQLAREVVDRFVTLWASERRLEVLAALIAARGRDLEVTRAGVAGAVDSARRLAEQELALARLRLRAITLEGQRRESVVALRGAVGWTPDGEAQAKGWPRRLREIVDPVEDHRVAEAQAASGVVAAERSALSQRSRPDFGLGLGWQEIGGGPDAFSLELSVRLPVDWVSDAASARVIAARERATLAAEKEARLWTAVEHSSFRAKATTAQRGIEHLDQEVIPAADRMVGLARANWTAGAGSYSDVATAEDTRLSIELERVALQAALRRSLGAAAAVGRSPKALAEWLREEGP